MNPVDQVSQAIQVVRQEVNQIASQVGSQVTSQAVNQLMSQVVNPVCNQTVNEMNDLDKSTIENEIRNLESENSDIVNNKLYVARKKIEALESTFYKN